MHSLRFFVGVLVVVLGLSRVAAAPAETSVPDPSKAAQEVTRQLGKTTVKSSYNLYCLMSAGTTKKENHEIERPSSGAVYDADIYRGYMRLNEDIDAYRNKAKGVIRPKGQASWFDTNATKIGRKLQRFLIYPDHLLERALDRPRRVEWIRVEEEPDDDELGEAPAAQDDEAPPRKGSTGVAEPRATGGANAEEVLPHLLRIQLSPQVAREFFTEARNSGVWDSGSG